MSSAKPAAAATDQAKLDQFKAKTLFRNTGPAMAVAILNVLIVGSLFWGHVETGSILTWGVVLVTVSAARWVLAHRALKAGTVGDMNWPVALSIIGGICWGLTLSFLGPDSSPVLSYLVIFMIAGMSAAAALSFSSHLAVVLAVNVPLLGMTAARFVEMGGSINNAMAGIIILYLISTTALARRNRAVMESAFLSRLRAERQAEEIRAMADDLQTALAAAESATVAKSRFLANMSHEMRTPLNGVLGMVQLLQRSELTDRQAEFTRIIDSSGNALLGVIDDVLDISRIESGEIRLHRDDFDLQNAVETCLDTIAATAAGKGLEIRTQSPDSLHSSRTGDRQRIQQILINLLGNAVKFTDSGSITLQITETGRQVRFDVVDTGPGLTEVQCGQVFERFAQVDDSSARRHGGSGLGLAISRDLVELMSGRIGVESRPGEGSRFWFEIPLPVSRAADQDDALGAVDPDRPAATPCTVLVVDDIATNRIVAKAMLESVGHQVVLAENGQEALDALNAQIFDLVLMDIQMPVMAGDEAISRIRCSGSDYRDIPIFAITANASRGEGDRLLTLGASAHATKPMDMNWLQDEIRRFDLPGKRAA